MPIRVAAPGTGMASGMTFRGANFRGTGTGRDGDIFFGDGSDGDGEIIFGEPGDPGMKSGDFQLILKNEKKFFFNWKFLIKVLCFLCFCPHF